MIKSGARALSEGPAPAASTPGTPHRPAPPPRPPTTLHPQIHPPPRPPSLKTREIWDFSRVLREFCRLACWPGGRVGSRNAGFRSSAHGGPAGPPGPPRNRLSPSPAPLTPDAKHQTLPQHTSSSPPLLRCSAPLCSAPVRSAASCYSAPLLNLLPLGPAGPDPPPLPSPRVTTCLCTAALLLRPQQSIPEFSFPRKFLGGNC